MAAAAPNSCTVAETRRHSAKRARTEVAGRPRALSSKPPSIRTVTGETGLTSRPGRRGLIAERILADDVANYLRFRAVCSSWRRRTASPHDHSSLDRWFNPRRWIMLPQTFGAIQKRRGLLNISTGERFLADLPELRRRHVLGPTSDGLIVICDKSTYAVSVLNRQLTAFLSGTTLLYPPESQITGWNSHLDGLQAFGAGPADDSSTMALHYGWHHLAVAKPDAERWSRWRSAVDVAADSQRPELVVAAEEELEWPFPNTVNLVDNGGEMILLNSSAWPRMMADLPGKYEVYRVDLDAGKMVPMQGLRGRAVFVGKDCHGPALSVPVGLSSSISADTVYRCSEQGDGRRIDAYHLLDRSIQHDFRGGKTVDYLSRYICRSDDTVVADAGSGPRKRKANAKVIGKEWMAS
ncbi:hypothetical protein ACQ4PT_049939 [Festuca glaucescens]